MAPVTVEVDWGDGPHRITWRAGKLVLEQHRDTGAEAAWVALGGERCPCLDVLSSWDTWRRDPMTLLRWSEPHRMGPLPSPYVRSLAGPVPSTPAEMLEALRRHHRDFHARFSVRVFNPAGAAGGPPPAVRQRMVEEFDEQYGRMWRDTLLQSLPDELRDRLALSAVVGAMRTRDEPQSWLRWRPAIERAVSAQAVPALQESIRFWRGRAGAYPRHPTVEAWVTKPGESVSMFGLVDKAGGWAAASLVGTWLIDVWALGLAIVDGCFVVAVTCWDEYPDRLSVLATRWERQSGDGSTPVMEPAVVVPAGPRAWALRWE